MKRRLLERLAVNGVAAVIGCIDRPEKLLNPVGLCNLPRVPAEPCPVQSNIGCYPVSIAVEMPEVAMPLHRCRRAVIIRVFRRKSGLRMAGKMKIGPASFSSLSPERPIRFSGP
ncbi:hypothetical protein D3C84_1051980 [compost metagenome]